MNHIPSYFSQMGEDRYVDTKVFEGMSGGIFVDIGAHDGKTFSNTYFFEKFRQWNGICIEPLPTAFAKLKKNRSAKAIQAVISKTRGQEEFIEVSGTDNADMFSGLARSFDARQLDTVKKEVKKRNGVLRTTTVQSYPLAEIFRKHNITHVDYCSIDTEGSELEILQTIDFSKVSITCFTIEDLYGNKQLRAFMKSKDYVLKETLDKDLVYIHKNFIEKNKVRAQVLSKRSATKSPLSLSVVIHTKNEERNIAACIASCKGLASEILVADMKSIDNTVKIAKKMNAKVVDVKDYGYADPARNTAILETTGDWILVLDADERLTPFLRSVIKNLIHGNQVDVVSFPRKNYMLGKWIQHGLRWPDYQVRLFRRGFASWEDEIHTLARYTGRHMQLPSESKYALIHHHSDTVRYLMDKTYLQASLERYYDADKNASVDTIYHRMSSEFSWRFFEHEGYKDGTHGLIVNKFMEMYRILEFALYWERTGYKEITKPETLKHLWSSEQQLLYVQEELKVIKDSKFYVFYRVYEKLKKVLKGK